MPEHAAGHHDPGFRRHGDRHEDGIDREREVHHLDLDDGRPERRQAEGRFRFGGRAARFGAAALHEVLPGEIQEIQAAEQLHPGDADQIYRQDRGDDPQGEPADQSEAQRLALVASREAQDHDGHHERVVGAEEPLQRHQQADGHEVGQLNVDHVFLKYPRGDNPAVNAEARPGMIQLA